MSEHLEHDNDAAETFVCHECGEPCPRDEACETGHGNLICEDCRVDEYFTSDYDDELYRVSYAVEVHGYRDTLYYTKRQAGAAPNVFRCSECGDYYTDAHLSDMSDVCLSCYESNYWYCEECDEHFGAYESCNCSQELDLTDELCSYSDDVLEVHDFKCLPEDGVEKRKATLRPLPFLGVELENTAYELSDFYDAARALKHFCIFKHDGSLPANGFEIVTAPATLGYHRRAWEKFFKTAAGALDATEDCGLHVHISQDSFTLLGKGKFLVFFGLDENQGFLTHLAGRDYHRNQYVNHDFSPEITDVETSGDIKRKLKRNRYCAVNCMNINTLEVRIFAATNDRNEFLARLQLVHAVHAFAHATSCNKLSWSDFAAWLLARKREEYAELRTLVVAYCARMKG